MAEPLAQEPSDWEEVPTGEPNDWEEVPTTAAPEPDDWVEESVTETEPTKPDPLASLETGDEVRPPDPLGDLVTGEARAPEDDVLDAIFAQSQTKDPERAAGVYALSKSLGLQSRDVEPKYDEYKRAVERARHNSTQFRLEQPELAKWLLEKPEAGSMVFKDEVFNGLTRALKSTWSFLSDWQERAGKERDLSIKKAEGSISDEQFKAGMSALNQPIDFSRFTPQGKTQAFVKNPIADDDSILRVPSMTLDAAKRGYLSTRRGELGASLMDAEIFGRDAIETRQQLHDVELELRPQFYNQGPFEQLAVDAAQGLGSAASLLVPGTTAGGLAGLLAFAGTTALTKNPALAAKAASIATTVMGTTVTASRSFDIQRGDAYLTYRELKTDDGKPVDKSVAAGMAIAEGLVNTTAEMLSLRLLGSVNKPIAELLKTRDGAAFIRRMASDATFASLAKRVVKSYSAGVAGEVGEEMLQDVAKDFFGYLAKSWSAGAWQKADVAGTLTGALETGLVSLPSAGLMASGPMMELAVGGVRHGRGIANESRLRAIREAAKGSKTIEMAPEVVAEAVARTTAESGEALTSTFIDPSKFQVFFQENEADVDKAAVEFIGPDGPVKLREAIATGEKVEVPMPLYIEKWAGKEIGEQLADHTTTRPDELTPAQRREQETQLNAQAQALVEEYEKGEAPPVPTSEAERRLVESVRQQLANSGKTYSEADARTAVALHRAVLKTQAAVFGVSEDTLFDAFATRVREGEAPTKAEAAQGQVFEQAARRKSQKPLPKPEAFIEQTASEPFKRWFQNSAVAAEGKPKMVFHGSSYSGFEAFDRRYQDPNSLYGPGFYFTEDPEIAGTYVDKSARLVSENKGESPGVYPVFLSLQNPIDADVSAKSYVAQLQTFKAKTPPPNIKRMIDSALREESENFTVEGLGAWVDNTEWAYNIAEKEGKNGEELIAPHFDYVVAKARDYMVKQIQSKRWGKGDDIIGFIKRNVFRVLDASKGDTNVQEVLKMFGFDGIAHTGGGNMGDKAHRVWIAFEPTQIKSAIGNRGTFDPDDPRLLYQDEDLSRRGFIVFGQEGARRLFDIVLTKRADLSTFLHESGHVFLEMMGDLAAREDAPQRIKDDWQRTLQYLGVESRDGIKKVHHEKWARAFEAYLYKGDAPSIELNTAFARFKTWLKAVYRSLLSLNAPLTDEIRGVFDRLLATDAEIEAVKKRIGMSAVLPTEVWENGEAAAEHLKHREKAFSRASLAAELRLMKDQLREQEAWWKEEEAKEYEQALKDFEQRKDVIAANYLKHGKLPDEWGGQTEAGGRLDRKSVEALVGKEWARGFRLIKEGGEDPDDLAEMFGYVTGRDLLDAVLAVPEAKSWAKAEASHRMKLRHGDILEEAGRLQAEIAKGFHGDATAKVILDEWRALRRKAEIAGQPTPIDSIKKAAQIIVEKRAIGKLNLGNTLNAERSAANKAQEAAIRGNYQQATVYKQQQLLNHYVYRELLEAQHDRDSFETFASKLSKQKQRGRLGLAHPSLRNAVDLMMERFGLSEPVPNEAEIPTQTIDEAVGFMALDGMAPAFDPALVRELLDRKVSWKELSRAEFRHLNAALRQMQKAAIDAANVRHEGKQIALADLNAEVAKEASKLKPEPLIDITHGLRKWVHQTGDFMTAAYGALRDPEDTIARLGRTAHRFLFLGYINARNAEDELSRTTLLSFEEKWSKLPEAMQAARYKPIQLPEALTPPKESRLTNVIDRQSLWMMALNMGNQSNRERLLGGYQWSEAAVLEFLNQNMTKEEWDFVQDVWNLLDKELYPHIAKTFESVNGLPPTKLQPTPMTTPFGTLQGGYFPAKYRSDITATGSRQEESAIQKLNADRSVAVSIAKGFTQGRVEGFTDIVDINWRVMPAHVAQVIHYATHENYIRDAARLVFSPEFKATVSERLGNKRLVQIESWLRFVANGQTAASAAELDAVYKFMDGVKSRFVLTAIGYSVKSAAGGLAGPLQVITSGELGWWHGSTAMLRAMTIGFRRMRAEAMKTSPELRVRDKAWADELRKRLAEVDAGGRAGRVKRAAAEIREFAGVFEETVDKIATTIVWEAGFREARAQGMSQSEAVIHADGLVRRNFVAKKTAEQPAILRDKTRIGAVMTFFSFFSKVFQVRSRIVERFIDGWGDGSKVVSSAKLIGQMLGTFVAIELLGEALSGNGPEDEEDTGSWALRKALTSTWAQFPIIGGAGEYLGQATYNALTGQERKTRINTRAAPTAAGIERILKQGAKVFDEKKGDDERALAAFELVLIGMNIPGGGALGRATNYVVKASEGEAPIDANIPFTDIEVPGLGVPIGLIYGPPREN